MLALPWEVSERLFDYAIDHAGDDTALALSLVSHEIRIRSFSARWRTVILSMPNDLYQFAMFLQECVDNGLTLPVVELVCWSVSCPDRHLWDPGYKQKGDRTGGRGSRLKKRVQRMFVGKGTPPPTVDVDPRHRFSDGLEALRWAMQCVLDAFAPRVRRLVLVVTGDTWPTHALLLAPFPNLENLAIGISLGRLHFMRHPDPIPAGWLTTHPLQALRRLHLSLDTITALGLPSRPVDAILGLHSLVQPEVMPRLTHVRFSGLEPTQLPALFAPTPLLPSTVQRIVFQPSPREWDAVCDHSTHRVNELPERLQGYLRSCSGDLSHRIALMDWEGGPNELQSRIGSVVTGQVGFAVSHGFTSRAETGWNEGTLILSDEMDRALCRTASSVFVRQCGACLQWII